MRKVEAFDYDTYNLYDLEKQINEWAEEEGVEIVQVSVGQNADGNYFALVVYEK